MKILDRTRAAVRSGHANFSFFCAFIGGILAPVSGVGHVIGFFARIGPWWAPIAWFVALLVICVGDWASDAVPNRPAVVTAILWPSCAAAALTGAQGGRIFDSIKALSNWFGPSWRQRGATWETAVNHFLNPSVPAQSAFTVFSIILLSAGLMYAQRYAKSTKAARTAGIPAGAQSRLSGQTR